MFGDLFAPRYPVRRRVLVNLKEGRAFSGVLWQRQADYLVLRDARLRNPGADPLPVDGEVLIYRADVSFIQVLASVEAAR